MSKRAQVVVLLAMLLMGCTDESFAPELASQPAPIAERGVLEAGVTPTDLISVQPFEVLGGIENRAIGENAFEIRISDILRLDSKEVVAEFPVTVTRALDSLAVKALCTDQTRREYAMRSAAAITDVSVSPGGSIKRVLLTAVDGQFGMWFQFSGLTQHPNLAQLKTTRDLVPTYFGVQPGAYYATFVFSPKGTITAEADSDTTFRLVSRIEPHSALYECKVTLESEQPLFSKTVSSTVKLLYDLA